MLKYLHENGADIAADDSIAMKWAVANNHFEIVKYLYENGIRLRSF